MSHRCPVCASEDLHEAGSISRKSLTKNGLRTFDMAFAVCRDCGFLFVCPVPDEAAIVAVHQAVFYPSWCSADPLGKRAAAIHAYLREAGLLRDARNMLEIGCGEGQVLELCRGDGLEAHGIEVRDELDYAGMRARGIAVFNGPFLEYEPEADFDLILMDNVLEHMADPGRQLRRVREMLSPGGALVLCVPYASADSDACYIPEHINYFSPVTLGTLAALTGFEEIDIPDPGLGARAFRRASTAARAVAHNDFERVSGIIHEYIGTKREKDRRKFGRVERALAAHLDAGRSVVFWGAGSYALNVFEHIAMPGDGFLGFIDSDPRKAGTDFLGKPIHAPAALAALAPACVFICTENRLFIEDIREFVRASGLDAAVLTVHDCA